MTTALLFISAGVYLLRAYSGEQSGNLSEQTAERDKESLGLMTSLPIYWNEGDAFATFGTDQQAALPWVRSAIEQRYKITPLDVLAAGDGTNNPLAELQRLAIIQPRGLSPSDNVALDDWVRAGGKLLYVIDPMLSGEYEAALGDPRHPTVTALVPPVIDRWGLALSFDEAQDQNPRLVKWGEVALPVVMGGQLSLTEPQKSSCAIEADQLVAQCDIGEGRVTIIADAALYEPVEGNDEAEEVILETISKALL